MENMVSLPAHQPSQLFTDIEHHGESLPQMHQQLKVDVRLSKPREEVTPSSFIPRPFKNINTIQILPSDRATLSPRTSQSPRQPPLVFERNHVQTGSQTVQLVFTSIWKVLLTICYPEDELVQAARSHDLTTIPIRQAHYPEILALFKKAFGPLSYEQPAQPTSARQAQLPFHEQLFLQHAGFFKDQHSRRHSSGFIFYERFCNDICNIFGAYCLMTSPQMFAIVLQLVFESITFSFAEEAGSEVKIYFKALEDIRSPFNSQLSEDKSVVKILTCKVLSKIFRHKKNCKPEPKQLKELLSRRFKPQCLLDKSQDSSLQFDNLTKIIKVTTKIHKRIQLLRDKDKRYRPHQPQYITHNPIKSEHWMMQVKRLTPVQKEDDDLETKYSIDRDESVLQPKIINSEAPKTNLNIPMTLKVNGRQIEELELLKIAGPNTPTVETARTVKQMSTDNVPQTSFKISFQDDKSPAQSNRKDDSPLRSLRTSVYEKIPTNTEPKIADKLEQEVQNIVSKLKESKKCNQVMIKNQRLAETNQFNLLKMLKPPSPLSQLSVYNCNSCTNQQCNQQHCHHQIQHQVQIQVKPSDGVEPRKATINLEDVQRALQTENQPPLKKPSFIERIQIQQDSLSRQSHLSKRDTNNSRRRGSQVVEFVDSIIEEARPRLDKQRSSLYDYIPLDIDAFTEVGIDNVFDQNVQTNEVSMANDHSEDELQDTSKHDVTKPLDDRLEILQRPRFTFLNKHAKFNRRNLLAVNRFNKIQIQENNRMSEQRKRTGLPQGNTHKAPIRIDMDSTEKFILVTGTHTPKDFFTNLKKQTFSQPRKTLQATKHDYFLFSDATSPASYRLSPKEVRVTSTDFRFRRKSGNRLGTGQVTPKAAIEKELMDGVQGQQISQLVSQLQKLADNNKDIVSCNSAETNTFSLDKASSPKQSQIEPTLQPETPKSQNREIKTIKTPMFTKQDEEIEVCTIRAESQVDNFNSTKGINYIGRNKQKMNPLQTQLAKRSNLGGNIKKPQISKQMYPRRGSAQSINKDLEINDRANGLGSWGGHDSMDSSHFGSDHGRGKSGKASVISGLESKKSPRDDQKRGPKYPVRQLNRTMHARQQTPISILPFEADQGFSFRNLYGSPPLALPLYGDGLQLQNVVKFEGARSPWGVKMSPREVARDVDRQKAFSKLPSAQFTAALKVRNLSLPLWQKTPQYRTSGRATQTDKDLTSVPFILKTLKKQ